MFKKLILEFITAKNKSIINAFFIMLNCFNKNFRFKLKIISAENVSKNGNII
jgi:hypothetical protein